MCMHLCDSNYVLFNIKFKSILNFRFLTKKMVVNEIKRAASNPPENLRHDDVKIPRNISTDSVAQTKELAPTCKAEVVTRLSTWLEEKTEDIAIKKHSLEARVFPGTGRGLGTNKSVKQGDLVLEMPESLIVSTSSARNTALAPVLQKFFPIKQEASPVKINHDRLTAHQVLCMVLLHERHLGEKSTIEPFINSLPPSLR